MTEYFEDEHTELKRELIDEIKSEIIAFLNSDGGIIYVGVEDDGSIIGINNQAKDSIDLKLGSWIQEAFFPKPSGLIRYYYNEDSVLIIEVSKGTNKPYYLREKGPKPSGVYIRVGRSKRKANDDEILRMIMDSHGYSYEDDISDEQTLTFKAFNQALEDNDIKLTSRLMNTLGLKNKTGKYTNLAYLLSDQSEIVVKVAEYDSEMNFKIKHLHVNIDGEVDGTAFFTGNLEKRAGFSKIDVFIELDADIDENSKAIWLKNVIDRCPVTDNIKNMTAVSFDIK